MSAPGRSRNAAATARITARRHQRLISLQVDHDVVGATDAARAPPRRCDRCPRRAAAPSARHRRRNPRRRAAMRSSSVAMMTEAAPLARAHSHTQRISGRPPISTSGLPGNRVAAKRAGITTWNTGRRAGLAIQQRIVRAQRARVFRQHQRDAVAHRVGQPVRLGRSVRARCRSRRCAADPCRSGTPAIPAVVYPSMVSRADGRSARFACQIALPAITMSSSVVDSPPSKCALTGTYQCRSIGQACAFYGILLGHEHRPVVGEARCPRTDAGMIGKGCR